MNSIADAGERPVTLSDLWIWMARGAVGRGNERVFLAGCGYRCCPLPGDFPAKVWRRAPRLVKDSCASRPQKHRPRACSPSSPFAFAN